MLDSHCHLNDELLFKDYPDYIALAQSQGVNKILVVGWNVDSSKKAVQIANEYENIYAAVGIHPENVEESCVADLDEICKLAKNKKVIAIGEIGLDYHWNNDESNHEKQKEYFIKQISLANSLNLPISVHSRDAVEDTYVILKDNPIIKHGVLHCYSGSVEMLLKFKELGMYFGFDGPITYKNSVVPKECVKECPLDRILTETDSPYLTPVPYRGQINNPSNIKFIIEEMARLKGISVDDLIRIIDTNFNKLFHGELYDRV